MNPADIIKDAVVLIKEYAQELSQKEHRDDVESGELIGYTEALFMSSMDSEFFAIWAAIRSTSRSESVELRICA